MKRQMVTTSEAMDILKKRGIQTTYQNFVLWVRKGLFKEAMQEATPRGPVWMIPADSVENFEPPKMGRPSKNASKKASKR